jgi:hypothetical protein
MRGRNFIISAIFVACGGAISSVDGNKDVSTLGANDQDQLCHDIINYVETSISTNDLKKFLCGITLTSSSDPITCKANFDKCMADPNRNISYSTMINCNGFSTTLLKCTGVTVSQFTECYKQEVDLIKSFAGKMPLCDKNSLVAAESDAINHISNQCMQVFLKCSISTTGGGTVDAGVPDASPPDSGGGGTDAGKVDSGGGGPPADGG